MKVDSRDRMAEKTDIISNQKGASIIAVIAIMLILAIMGAALVSLVTTGSDISINQLQSEQALYVAEGGIEYSLRNGAFPNYFTGASTIALGSGNFSVAAPTYLTADPGVAGTTINVNSTSGFASPSGRIVIESELIDYTGTTANSFTGATRGAGTTLAAAHAVDSSVYPATTVTDNPLAAVSATINVSSNVGFLIPGFIMIDKEYIYCQNTNGTTQFTNCIRGYKSTVDSAHLVNRNVFQYVETSTGISSNAQRVIRRTVAAAGGTDGRSFKQGSFTKSGAVGNQSITGVGFQPNAVIFFWTRQTAEGFASNESMGMGFATALAQRAIAIESDDAANRTNYTHIRSENSIILMLVRNAVARANATLNARASLVSLDSDGFTINWATNEASNDIIHYIALGGDIANVFVGTFNSNTVVGNQAVAGVGFQPDFVMLLNGSLDSAEATNTPIANKVFNIGFMTSAGQAAIADCGRDDRNAANHSRNQQSIAQSIMSLQTGNCNNQDSLAAFVSMNANGFTITWTNAPANQMPIFYLAIKGGQHKIGTFTQPTAGITPVSQAVSGVGFQPELLFMASHNRAAGGIAASGEISIGAAQSSTTEGAIWSESRDVNPPVTDANMATLTTKAIRMATSQTTNAEADFVSNDSDGFTLSWTTIDGTGRIVIYWAIDFNIARSGAYIKPSNLEIREVY